MNSNVRLASHFKLNIQLSMETCGDLGTSEDRCAAGLLSSDFPLRDISYTTTETSQLPSWSFLTWSLFILVIDSHELPEVCGGGVGRGRGMFYVLNLTSKAL